MILVDTSVWIDHLHRSNARLASLLSDGQVLTHPCVIGELALGSLKQRDAILNAMHDLPRATIADDAETLRLINANMLYNSGIGWVDAQLLASARLSSARLWTNDKRLHAIATSLGLA